MAGGASANTPSSNEKRLICRILMICEAAVSLVLDLEAVRADIDLQALGLLLGLVEIVAEHGDRDDQRADDQEHHIAVAGHGSSPLAREFSPVIVWARQRFS